MEKFKVVTIVSLKGLNMILLILVSRRKESPFSNLYGMEEKDFMLVQNMKTR